MIDALESKVSQLNSQMTLIQQRVDRIHNVFSEGYNWGPADWLIPYLFYLLLEYY